MARRVIVIDHAWPDLDIEREVLSRCGASLIAAGTGDEEECLRLAPTAQAILVNWKPVSRAVLTAATDCQTVARYGIGIDNIDVQAATELGMIVSRVADYCADEVAEHALALLMALRRHVVAFSRQTRAGGWDNSAFGPINRIRGTVLGIVGWGAIARAVADRACGLGMEVRVFTRTPPAGGWPAGVSPVGSLPEMAAEVDHLSVHVPLTEQTRSLIDERVLRCLKPTAVVINTARAPVIDAIALARALRDGRIAGAGLDVLDAEPPAPDNPLIGMDNVIVTPHAAFNSTEALGTLRRQAAANVLAVLQGKVPQTVANPEVLTSPVLRLGKRETLP